MLDKCGVNYRLSKLYEQFNDIRWGKCSCVNEVRLFRKTKCLMRAVKAVMAPSCRASQGPIVTLLRKRCLCKLISQLNLRQTLFYFICISWHTHTHAHMHQHPLAACHVGVRLRDSGEGQQTGAVSTFHQGNTVTHTHTDSSPAPPQGRSSLFALLFLCNIIFTRTFIITSGRVVQYIAFLSFSDLYVARQHLRTSFLPVDMQSSLDWRKKKLIQPAN